MKLTILDSERAFFSEAAWRIAGAMMARPDALIGLSTGRTTGGIHRALAQLHHDHPFDTSRVSVFGLDEITGITREDPGSCYAMLLNELVRPLGIPLDHFIMPPVQSDDFPGECRRFMQRLERRGPVDLLVVGIGENGHIGFNQPGTPFGSTCWISRMDEALDARIRRETGSAPDADLGGFTMGIADIMHCPRLVLVANGGRKAAVVREALRGSVSEDLPASVLQLHPNCECILDASAASLL